MAFLNPRPMSRKPVGSLPAPAQSASSSRHPHQHKQVGHQGRVFLLLVMTTLLLLGVMGPRLAYLQLMQTSYYQQLADTNRIRLIPKAPERGRILDRNGVVLAGSQLSHTVYLWPLAQSREEWQETIPKLATYLDLPAEEIAQRLDQAGYRSPFPVRILRNVSPEVIITLEERSQELPGVRVEAETSRQYPHNAIAAHVLGYTGEISEAQLEDDRRDRYRLGDIVGQLGVEAVYQDLLHGEWGGQQVEVDAAGEVLQVLGEQTPRPGDPLTLTLDLQLQKVAEQALGSRLGAVVAMDPRDGAILAMASYPVYDPNIFSTKITQDQWDAIQKQAFPFLNRSLRAYPPASTFKILTATAGMESGVYGPGTVLNTAPYISVSGHLFWDWNRTGFGRLNYISAMAWSSDTFFYQIALGTKAGPIQEWSRRFGLGRPTGIGLPGESPGIIPDEAWKQTHWGQPWYAGDTVNMSIGQGAVNATPLQMAVVTAAVANGGYWVRPILSYQPTAFEAAHPSDGSDPASVIEKGPVGLSESTLRVVQEGLRAVIQYGTGTQVALPYVAVAGKSGTAEDPPRRSHTWFVSYAPYEAPEIVVVAFLENSGGGGGSVTGPICRQVMDAYFQLSQ